MRVGVSDTKNVTVAPEILRHRIILPVYFPRLTGYFTDGLTILEMCLESLRLTAAHRVSVTLIANSCVQEALDVLERRYNEGWIDQLVINKENRGRIDAVAAAARAAYEPLVTLSDSDVMFKHGWVDAVETLMATFPECGMASIVPHPGTGWHHTSATVLAAMLKGELSMAKVVSDEDIDRFGHSIGVPDWVKPEQRNTQLIVQRNGTTACVGCGHFLFTLRKESVQYIPPEACNRPLGAGSDEIWYDRPPDLGGLWRLATPNAYAYHLGNVPEPWMKDALEEIRHGKAVPTPAVQELPPLKRTMVGRLPWGLRTRLSGALKPMPVSSLLQHKGRRAVAQPRLGLRSS